MKNFILCIVFYSILSGCSANKRSEPRISTPPTPAQFIEQIYKQGDNELSCNAIAAGHRYLGIYSDAINRIFDTKGPTAMNSTAYTTTSGISSRYGSSIVGSSTSRTYGGGTVHVYEVLTLRAMDITKSTEKRQSELRRLSQRRGDCSANDLDPSHKLLEDFKRQLDSAERHMNAQLAVMASNEKIRSTYKWPREVRIQEEENNRAVKQQLLNDVQEAKTRYQALLQEHQANHLRAEREALEKRNWFDVNTKTVLE